MAYLLDLIAPGVGHLVMRRWLVGLVLLVSWIAGTVIGWVATSFDLTNLLLTGAWHVTLGAFGALRLAHLGRRGKVERSGVVRSLVLALAVPAILTGLFVTTTQTLVRPAVVRSGSMMPGVRTGDVLLVQLFGPFVFGISRGDIVFVAHPTERGRMLIKRILGVAGDLIEVRGGELFRNGRALAQCRLRTHRDPESKQQVIERLEVQDRRPYLVWDQPAVISKALRVRVPAGHAFVAGDNRDRSGDSRSFGTVPLASIRGTVRVRLFPAPRNALERAPTDARRAAYRVCGGRGARASGRQNAW